MTTVRVPETGEEIEDRRREERRSVPDRRHSRAYQVQAVVWAIVGAAVVLFLFLLALNTFSPAQAPVATIVVLVLAVLWLVHAWRRLYAGGFVDRPDRERRGF
jgi:protein-S-isoprenylcysteine O-methyltransferase Ste14